MNEKPVERRFGIRGFAVGGFYPIEEFCQTSFFKNEKPPPSPGSGPFVVDSVRLLPEKPFELCFAGSVARKHRLQVGSSQMPGGDLTKDISEICG